MSSSPTSFSFEKFDGNSITDAMLEAAAELFSNNYGVWGAEAANKIGPFAKQGRRVKMNTARLRAQCLPQDEKAEHTYVKIMVGDALVGNVFATRWEHEGRTVCWITQLVVSTEYRAQGLATKLLTKLREGYVDCCFGIASSHPFAISAALRAFGRGLAEVDLSMTQEHATSIMSSSPIEYVRNAKLKGSLFEDQPTTEGTVSCVNTEFYVDHAEPLQALEATRAKGIFWPFGILPDGYEFLVLVKGDILDAAEQAVNNIMKAEPREG